MQLRDIAKGDCQSSVSHIPVSRIPLLLADVPAQFWAFRCIDAGQPNGERLNRLTHRIVAPSSVGRAVALTITWTQMAKRPVQLLPKGGGCPLGCCRFGDYCVPSTGSNTRGVIKKGGAGYLLGWYSSGS